MTELLHPAQWLRVAALDMYAAEGLLRLDPQPHATIAFHAQQCAERALKAVLMHLREDIPYVHEIERLLSAIAKTGVIVPPEVEAARSLTKYATETRYADPDTVSAPEALEAVEIAAATLAWARKLIGSAAPS